MNRTVASVHGGKDRIGFKSLPDLFGWGRRYDLFRVQDRLPEVHRLLPTKSTEQADMCRRILMAGFQPHLFAATGVLDPALVALYRGFSKFMLEDLATNRYTRHLSRSRLRKKAAEVAKAMIEVTTSPRMDTVLPC
jgi:pyoverdine/dityrosine biosynthesis protein Dit1